MVSRIEPDRYADTGFSIADTPPDLNVHLIRQMMQKTGPERLITCCAMAVTVRQIVWSGIPQDLSDRKRRQLFIDRCYGKKFATAIWLMSQSQIDSNQ